VLSRRRSSVVDPARIDQMMKSVSRSPPELAARTRQCHPHHPPPIAPKVKVVNPLAATQVSLTTSHSATTSTHKTSWRQATPNTHTTPQWTTTASHPKRSNPKPLTPPPHSATTLNPTVAPSQNISPRTPPRPQRASTATTHPQASANPHPVPPPATTTTTSRTLKQAPYKWP